MKKAIDETERRRVRQLDFNARNGIKPIGIVKHIRDMIDGVVDPQQLQSDFRAAQDKARYESMSAKEIAKEIRLLEKQMLEHARNLEFEKAAQLRDRLATLRKNAFGAAPEDEVPLA